MTIQVRAAVTATETPIMWTQRGRRISTNTITATMCPTMSENQFSAAFTRIVIHFPIAGLPLALLGFLVWVRSGREAFARSDAIPLFAAALASIAAVITGNIAHDSMRFSESLHVIVERHQFVSTTIMVIAICLSVIRLWRWNGLIGKWRWVYGGGLAIVCALLGYTGFLGGSLVFGPDHLAW